MYLIVGLGNPEPEYSRTRHNMGFDVLNQLAISQDIVIAKHQFHGTYGTGTIGKESVMLLKPQTFMNLSGTCVKRFVDYYKIPLDKVLVVYDDMDTEKGYIRIRKKGNSGSHNGMRSLVEELNSTDFARIRVGIGRPEADGKIDYVVGKMQPAEYEVLQEGIEKARQAILCMLQEGLDTAMNRYNEKRKEGENSEGNCHNEQ